MEVSEVSAPQSEVAKPNIETPRGPLKSGAENLLKFLHFKKSEKEAKPAEILAEVRDGEDMKSDSEAFHPAEVPSEATAEQTAEPTIQAQSVEVVPPESSEAYMTPDQAVAIVGEVTTNAAGASKWHEMFINNAKNPAVLSGLIVAGVGLANAVGVAPDGPQLKMALEFITKAIVSEGGVKGKVAKALLAVGASDLVSDMVGSEMIETVGEEALGKGREIAKNSEKVEKISEGVRSAREWGRNRVSIKPKLGSKE